MHYKTIKNPNTYILLNIGQQKLFKPHSQSVYHPNATPAHLAHYITHKCGRRLWSCSCGLQRERTTITLNVIPSKVPFLPTYWTNIVSANIWFCILWTNKYVENKQWRILHRQRLRCDVSERTHIRYVMSLR